jgi:hypothetical protein
MNGMLKVTCLPANLHNNTYGCSTFIHNTCNAEDKHESSEEKTSKTIANTLGQKAT